MAADRTAFPISKVVDLPISYNNLKQHPQYFKISYEETIFKNTP